MLWEEFRNEHVNGIKKFEREDETRVRTQLPFSEYTPLGSVVKPSTMFHLNEHVKGINKFESEAVTTLRTHGTAIQSVEHLPVKKIGLDDTISVQQHDFGSRFVVMNVLDGGNEFDDMDLEDEMRGIDTTGMNGSGSGRSVIHLLPQVQILHWMPLTLDQFITSKHQPLILE